MSQKPGEEGVKKKKPKKKFRLSTLIFALIFLIGLGILTYPIISNQWNNYRQSRLISNYEQAVSQMTEEDFTQAWEDARAYNATFDENHLLGDVFDGENKKDLTNSEYWKVLNITGDGIMGYITIPKIAVKLGIYHGTDEEVLQTGVGHLYGTKLPIGGEANHSVLSAHRGLPSAKLFTDIDQMVEGDQFYLTILDDILAYQVDQILPMVDKDDHEALETALAIDPAQDYVTLFTCTPYGVNSHRLLVRGHRVPYNGELDGTPVDSMVQAIRSYYMLYLLMGLGITVLGILASKYLLPKLRKRKGTSGSKEGTN
ncbi:MAG: class C sortase [Firmicutes bacterium]|jgi:sortase A|nr:class C sortase [Bacillota bacterium]